MATLVSPGVSISVSDESFYAPAGAGTVPLIVIATAQDKTAPDGTSTAAYTTSATANKLYQITSQRELLQNFGNPSFGAHGSETNEYGLMAAYSFLGISNRAYVLRADIDLGELEASSSAPSAKAANGTYWLDTDETLWGFKKWNGSKWIAEKGNIKVVPSNDLQSGGTPKPAFGKNDEICVRYYDADGTQADDIKFYQKVSNVWYHIGSSAWNSASSKDFQVAVHTALPATRSNGNALVSGDLILQSTAANNGTAVDISQYNSSTGQWVSEENYVRQYERTARGLFEADNAFVKGVVMGDHAGEDGEATVRFKEWNGEATVTLASSAAISDTAISNSYIDASNASFKINVDNGTDIEVFLTSETNGNIAVDDVVADIQAALSSANVTTTFADQVSASNVSGKVTLVNSKGNNVSFKAGNNSFVLSLLNLDATPASNWKDISFEAQATAPVGTTANATLWYDADISTDNIDLMYHNGSAWATYNDDWQTKASEPTTQSDGSTSLSGGEIWIDSSDTENIKIYKRDGNTWVLVDQTDQSSEDGILFADARKDSSSANDSDAPNTSLYPAGMLLWNTRASGGGVKQYIKDHTVGGVLIGDRWVNYSGNHADGSMAFLRKAQRKAVVKGLQAAVAANEDIRNETNRFNLVAVPGYPELTDEMLGLSVDRKDTVFALIDAPFRLNASATTVQNWATNGSNAVENGENGLLSSSSQAAVYYPHGLTTNLDGTNVMVPASHMALRTFAYNDQVAFPWFAPAGFQRGLVSNATSVGYLDPAEGEFTPVALNEGQRDAYYLNKVNPVGNFPGRGLAIFGQKTLNANASALDRVNVSRLVIYIREQLDDAVKPFLFEPNDSTTRLNAKGVVDRVLSELVIQRGLYDYVSVCDTSNNTPARIDRNELHIDVAIQPVKAVEFIYIPIRIQNTLGSTG